MRRDSRFIFSSMRFRASKSVDWWDTQWCFVWFVSFGIVITVWEAVGCAFLLCIAATRPFSEMRGIILGDFAEIWLTRLECCIQSNCSNFDTPTSFTAQCFIAWPIVATILDNNLNLCSLLPTSTIPLFWNLKSVACQTTFANVRRKIHALHTSICYPGLLLQLYLPAVTHHSNLYY